MNELKKFGRSKATGADGLAPGMLKDIRQDISHPLCYILNLSIETSTVPTLWKLAKIIPIHKSGSYDLPENFRPISVLPVLSKLLEKAVHGQYLRFLENDSLLTDCQYGYRAKRSTNLATIQFIDDIRHEVDRGNLVGAIFIDLSKAFDTINHGALLTKLQAYGIQGKELAWFTNYLFGRQQYVQLGSKKSTNQLVFTGVPQGSVLGPLLFLVFYNDFVDIGLNSHIIKYADDTVIYYSGQSIEVIENVLSDDMDLVAQYFDENEELIINLKSGKTEMMLFGTEKRLSGQPREMNVEYRGQPINVTQSYKYLGYLLDPTLTFNENFEVAYKKASNRVRLLSKLGGYVTPNVAAKIYQMMISPIIMYSGTIKLFLTETNRRKLRSIDNRVREIVGEELYLPQLYKLIKKKACEIVRKCLDKDVCTNFREYFETNIHGLNTRNSNILVKLPKVKLEFGRHAFRFAAAKIYNELPKEIRAEKDYKLFRFKLDEYFR